MEDKPRHFYYQSGVIAYRTSEGRLEVMLITSRGHQHWVIPKGVIEPGFSPDESAAKEAYEEAGIGGAVSMEAIGKYDYPKWGGTCEVQVFPMEVQSVLDDWPEKNHRQREWLPTDEAIERVKEDGLKELLGQFKSMFASGNQP